VTITAQRSENATQHPAWPRCNEPCAAQIRVELQRREASTSVPTKENKAGTGRDLAKDA